MFEIWMHEKKFVVFFEIAFMSTCNYCLSFFFLEGLKLCNYCLSFFF